MGAVGIGVVSFVPAILIVPTAYHDVFIVACLVGLFLYLDFQRFLIFRRDVTPPRNGPNDQPRKRLGYLTRVECYELNSA